MTTPTGSLSPFVLCDDRLLWSQELHRKRIGMLLRTIRHLLSWFLQLIAIVDVQVSESGIHVIKEMPQFMRDIRPPSMHMPNPPGDAHNNCAANSYPHRYARDILAEISAARQERCSPGEP